MYIKFFKRFIDVFLSLIGLIVLAIPMIIISAVVKLESSGPAIFKQERVGLNKKIFTLYKFRTMKTSAPITATHDLENPDQYITKFGHFMRRFSIDEFPQLLNILKGDMSIIGPRPVIPAEEDLISQRDLFGVYSIKPGLTGWAQINGRGELGFEEKARLDADYMENISFWFDLKCFFTTISKVFKSEGVVEGKVEEKPKEESAEKETVKK